MSGHRGTHVRPCDLRCACHSHIAGHVIHAPTAPTGPPVVGCCHPPPPDPLAASLDSVLFFSEPVFGVSIVSVSIVAVYIVTAAGLGVACIVNNKVRILLIFEVNLFLENLLVPP